jgi:ABC-type transporter Mla subunit MlaD
MTMSNAATRSQNNIKAGIFVTIAILIGLSVLFVLGDFKRLFQASMTQYTVIFPVTEGVQGLGQGSFVDVGGIQVGEVDSVALLNDVDSPVSLIEVAFSIPSEFMVHDDAIVSIQSGLLSTSSWLSFTSMGAGGTVLEPGGMLEGSSLSMMDRLLGSGPAANMASTLESFAAISGQLETNGELVKWVMGDESAARLDETIISLQSAVEQGDDFLATLNADWASWSGDIDTLMAQADDFAQALRNVSDLINENGDAFQHIVDDLESTMANVDSVSETLRTSTWPKVEVFVDTAQSTLLDVQTVVGDVKARSSVWIADLDRTLANVLLAAQQLNQLLGEVKANPWRLLYRPTDKQLGQELIYEASRNFVFGAADLKSAAGAMERLLDARGSSLAADDSQLEALRTNLMDSAERYQRAQEQLMELLQMSSPSSTP